MLNQSKLDAIIFDNRNNQNLESHLNELNQMPENYVNSVCQKSLDEMNEAEREQAVSDIEEYLKDNVEDQKEFLKRATEENDYQCCDDDKIKTVQDFQEDDNLGWKKEIEGVVYYKTKDLSEDVFTVSIQNDELIIE